MKEGILVPLGQLIPQPAGSCNLKWMIKSTGEYRFPKSNEWFISGEPPIAFIASHNMCVEYDIGRRVLVEEETTITLIRRRNK